MKPLSEHLRESIEEEIATGRLPPGYRLEEAELARRFGVSRTPIREALRSLLGEGLVENRPRRGSVIAQLTPQRVFEMFEVMSELEAMCVRLAARRMSDEDLRAIEAAHSACSDAETRRDLDAYFHANERFHFALYAASHNAFLFEQALSVQRKLRPYRRLQLRARNRLQRSLAEHQTILGALAAGDVDLAIQSVRNHVMVQGERFADLIATLDQMAVQVPELDHASA